MRILLLLAFSWVVTATQPVARYRELPTLRQQNELELGWIQGRYDRIHELLDEQYVSKSGLPSLLTSCGYDAWIITQREYAEDTVFRALVPATTTFSARRRTLYMFHNSPRASSPLHMISLKDDLWDALNETLHQVDPKKIAVNVRHPVCRR
jgi:hypothetical protein